MAEIIQSTIPSVTQDQRMKGALAYVLGWLTGIVVLLIAKDDKFLKFHAWQAIIYGVAAWIVGIVLDVIILIALPSLHPVFWLMVLLVFLYQWYGAYLVYSGKEFRIPVIVDYVPK